MVFENVREELKEGWNGLRTGEPDTSLKGGYGRCLCVFVADGDWTIRVRCIATWAKKPESCAFSIRTKSIKKIAQNLAESYR